MRKRLIGTLFPNVNEAAGFYSPTAFCITLNRTTTRQLGQVKPLEKDCSCHRKILYHEMRHNIDHLSTLWGQRRILNLFDALNSRMENKEQSFYKIVKYKLEEKQLHFNNYYSEEYNRVSYKTQKDRWVWSLSSGIRFNDLGNPVPESPILFIKFASISGVPINRVPVSIASLLETNAMFEETVIEQNYLSTLNGEKKQKERDALDKAFIKNIIYNQELAVYNCAVHLTANLLQISNIYDAFRIASSVATVVLNMPEDIVLDIPIATNEMKEWEKRPANFLLNKDYGFLFFNLLNNYKAKFKETGSFQLEEFLKINGLPGKASLENRIIVELESIADSITKGKFFVNFFSEQVKVGKNLFKMRGLDGTGKSLVDTLMSGQYAPFIIKKDDHFQESISVKDIYKDPSLSERIGINDWYFIADEMSHKMEEFYSVRGV